ncbi:hypothetical protein [Bradyrhizobium sp. BR 10289]|uniref:hypothetical protein n=1 Tax=Bradyrhizobium sp. BR 10289 TaxID=2749993 RepID=UPI001C651A8F|nr:hypothetical protein [Bradyrhizobium sp. BR 10289]MBW7970101.1 hypothetical protein [Bradyrhizobium sp. BR 10289]
MSKDSNDEIATLARQIAEKKVYLNNQAILIDVLEHGGHDMDGQRKSLEQERLDLRKMISRKSRLLSKRGGSTQGPNP